MATTIDEVLASALQGITGNSGVTDQFTSLAQHLRALEEASQDNTRAVERNTSSQGQGAGSTVATVGRTLQSFMGLGLGLSPLLTGLLRLFGGGGESTVPPPMVKFSLPPSVNVSAGVSERAPEAFAVDYRQGNVPRPVAAPQITVQVQAMDSRSFLDHSNDIALAVRQAMLESGVLNDVIREA